MRILHACKYFFPRVTGVTAYVDNLARQQLSHGHEVAVASWGDEVEVKEHQGLPVLRAKPGDAGRLVRLMSSFQPDVIHVHSIWETTYLAVDTACELNRPFVVTTHGTWHFLKHTGAYDRWRDWWRLGVWQRRIAWPRLIRRAGGVIALNAMEEADARRFGVSPDRLQRIPNAVDVEQFQQADKLAANQSLEWPTGFTVLFVGALQAQKGLFTILEAVGMLGADAPIRWVFCGDGPDLDRAKEVVRAAGLSDRVVFLGRISRERMPTLYQAADAVVLPSQGEPFATVFLEAMASGLPCIGSNDGGTPEIIVEGKTGFLVPPRDAKALADKVSILAREPRMAQAMGLAGRERAVRNFSWTQIADRIERVYRHALLLVCLFLLLSVRQALAVTPLDILTMRPAPDTPGQQNTNPVFDGATIRLQLARGESTAFQVIVPETIRAPGTASENAYEDVAISLRLDPSVSVALYRQWSIWGTPEVAVPMTPGKPRLFPSFGETNEDRSSPWRGVVEIEASRQASAGVLQGELTVQWKEGQASFPLEVTILPFSLPLRPSFVVEMNSYGDYLRLLPPTPEMFTTIFRLFHQFRCTFTLVPYRQDGSLLMDFLAPTIAGEKVDFTNFDAALGGIFDGTAFIDGQPPGHFLLPFREGWPASGEAGVPGARDLNILVREAVERHIREKGWGATRFQEFHNENPEHGASVPWRLDEPTSESDLYGHSLFLRMFQAACKNDYGHCSLTYRIDISNWRPLVPGLGRLGGTVTDWSVSADPAFLDKDAVEYFRKLGANWLLAYGEIGGFQSGRDPKPWVDYPATLARFFLLGVDGFAQWLVDCWKDKNVPGVPDYAVPLVYSNAAGARDFIWPGKAFGLESPVPSLRLFALREGLNLLDYVNIAGRLRPDRLPMLRNRLRGLIGRKAEDWYAFKTELAGQLAKERICSGATPALGEQIRQDNLQQLALGGR